MPVLLQAEYVAYQLALSVQKNFVRIVSAVSLEPYLIIHVFVYGLRQHRLEGMHPTHKHTTVQIAPAVLRWGCHLRDVLRVWKAGFLGTDDDAAPRLAFELLKLSEYFRPTAENQRIKRVCKNPGLQG